MGFGFGFGTEQHYWHLRPVEPITLISNRYHMLTPKLRYQRYSPNTLPTPSHLELAIFAYIHFHFKLKRFLELDFTIFKIHAFLLNPKLPIISRRGFGDSPYPGVHPPLAVLKSED